MNTETAFSVMNTVSTVALVIIGISQAFIIPFVKGLKGDIKTATDSMQQMQLTLARIEVNEKNDVELRRAAEARYEQLHGRVHKLASKLNGLMLHLAVRGLYTSKEEEADE